MALGLNLGPAVYPSVGSGALALASTYADTKLNRWIPQLENGQTLAYATVLADLFNLAPDGTRAGQMLDGARDGAVFSLVQSYSVGSMLGGGSAAASTPATPVAAAAASGNAAGLTSAVPAANSSAVADTNSSGY